MLYRSDDVGRPYQRNVNKSKTWLDLVEVIAKLPEEREKLQVSRKNVTHRSTCLEIFINIF